jgi:hypothetical protein
MFDRFFSLFRSPSPDVVSVEHPPSTSDEAENPVVLPLRFRLAPDPVTLSKRFLTLQQGSSRIVEVPRDVWCIILGFLDTAEDAISFGRVCSLFAICLRCSQVWPRLLDLKFGAGLSTVLSQSRCILDSVHEKRVVDKEELRRARETFYRRARLEVGFVLCVFHSDFAKKKKNNNSTFGCFFCIGFRNCVDFQRFLFQQICVGVLQCLFWTTTCRELL